MPLATSTVETLITPAEIPVASPGGIYWTGFAQTLANLGTSAATVITWTPGHRFKLLSVIARTAVAGTGSSASQVLTAKINGTAMTGGVLTLTLANQQTTYGQNVSATSITDGNEGDSNDIITLVLAASGTAFSAGQVDLLFQIQNLDG